MTKDEVYELLESFSSLSKEEQESLVLKVEPKLALIGKRFGKLTVKSYIDNDTYACNCDCGSRLDSDFFSVAVKERYLKSGDVKSCGCSRTSFKADQVVHDLTLVCRRRGGWDTNNGFITTKDLINYARTGKPKRQP